MNKFKLGEGEAYIVNNDGDKCKIGDVKDITRVYDKNTNTVSIDVEIEINEFETVNIQSQIENYSVVPSPINDFYKKMDELERKAKLYDENEKYIEIGKATEKAFNEYPYFESMYGVEDDDEGEMEINSIVFESIEELVEWYRKEIE